MSYIHTLVHIITGATHTVPSEYYEYSTKHTSTELARKLGLSDPTKWSAY
jgi:hypothetical protein